MAKNKKSSKTGALKKQWFSLTKVVVTNFDRLVDGLEKLLAMI